MAKVTIANLNTLLDTVVTSNIAVQTAQSAVTNATVQANNAATSAQAAALSKSQIDQQVIVAEGLADDVNANMLATDAIKDVILALEVAIGLKADQVTLDKATVAAMLDEVLTAKSGVDVKAGLIEELVEDFHTKYLGALLVAPTVSWGGMELATGMLYYDIAKNSLMIYVNANIWVPIIDTVNMLIATNNLADLHDKAVARTNLDVMSTSEVEAQIQVDIAAIKGQPLGLAELDAAGLVPASQLPSYVDDVIEIATYADLPAIGEKGKIYIVVADETSNGDTSSYRWTGIVYAMVSNTLNASDVKALYEANPDTNEYSDAEKVLVDVSQILETTATTLPTAINELVSVKVDKIVGSSLVPDTKVSLYDSHIIDTANPHAVTKAQVGLSNADNTRDNVKNVLSATKWTTARTITLSGDVSGSASVDGSANVTITTTVQPNSVNLGTDTTGNYMVNVTAGSGISVSHTQGEGSTATITNSAPNVTTNITTTHTSTNVVVNSSDGTDGTINSATQTLAGVMSAADKTKLDGIEAGATGDQTASEILTLLKTVDGSGSGVDADLLDGQEGAYYLNASNINTGTINDSYLPDTITSDITGNAATATKLSTARTISLTGDVTGGVNFDGNANVSITTTVADDSHNHVIANVDGLQTALDGKLSTTGKAADSNLLDGLDSTAFEKISNKGKANGYAGLDATGKVPTAQLPSFVDDVLEYVNLAGFPTTGETGKIYVALDTNKTYRWSGSTYVYITSGAVDSVAGKTGVVTLVKADVGLGSVDNTSDLNKPVSTATQTALNGKVNNSQVLTNVPVNAVFTDTIYTHPAAHPASIITQDLNNRFVTDVEKTTWNNKASTATVTTLVNGLMLSTDKVKLDAVTGTNTGDETAATIKSKLGITTLSGSNTGDQTTITGNAGSATVLQTARTINGVSFNGSANITINAVDSTARVASTEKGVANGVATLDASGLVPTSQLPSYVDDVLEYDALPASGEIGKIYIRTTDNTVWRWSGSAFIEISVGTGTADAAVKLATARTINGTSFDGTANITTANWGTSRTLTLDGDLSGSVSINGSANVTLTATVADDSHNHVISNVDGLQVALDSKVDKVSKQSLDSNSALRVSGTTVSLYKGDGTFDSITTQDTVYTLPTATSTVKGGIEIFSDTVQTVASNTVSTTAGRTYGIQLNSAGQAVVNIPWSDTNTVYTHPNSGVTTGTYPKVTVNAQGHITAGASLSASDIPSLDASKITSGTIDPARLPSFVDDVLEFVNLAGFPATGEAGKIYIALDTNKAYRWSGSTYVYITSGAVDSVAGKTGVVTLVKGDVGLGNVDNTSDSSKNVLSATKWTTGRTITIGDTGKTVDGSGNVSWSLAEIGAQAAGSYQPLDATLTALAGVTTAADKMIYSTGADTFTTTTVSSFARMILDDADAAAVRTTIGAQPLDADLTAIAALAGTSGLLKKTAADTWTLDTNNYVTSSGVTSVTGTAPIVSSGGTTPSLSMPAATASVNGYMTSAYATKLDGIATNANNYSHPTGDGNLHVPATGTTNNGKVLTAGATAGSLSWQTVAAGVTDHTLLSNVGTNTHAQIDTALAKLNGIAAGAEVNVNADWNAVSGDAQILNKPVLATVATSGSYADLSNKPTIDSAPTNGSTNSVSSDGVFDALALKAPLVSPTFTTPNIGVASGTSFNSITALASVVPVVAGTAAVGTSTTVARADHVHPAQTTITGNAATATKLATPRTINGVSFDGTANITVNAVDSIARIAASEKGVANGVATLDGSGLVPSNQLPSYVDDVLEYSTFAGFPATGAAGKIYVDLATNKTYRWSGSAYVYITSGAVDSIAGKTGVVTLVKADVGLANVDNTADVNKNVLSATKLATGRTIGMTGDVSWTSASFNGSGNVTGTSTLATVTDSGIGAFKKITTDTKGRVTGTQDVTQSDITGLLGTGSISNSMLVNTAVSNLSGTNTGDQTITLSGDVAGSGTGTFSTVLSNTGVVAGTYKSLTVDAKGRVSAGTNPTTLSGYGITDAAPSSHIGSTGNAHGVATTSTNGFMSTADKTKLDGVASGANNYVLPTATSTIKGGIEIFSDTVQTVASNTVSTTASRTYGIQLNAAGQAVVNVPWVGTNTTTTVENVLTSTSTTNALSAAQGKALQDSKVAANAAITAGTGTKVTYDAKGLVTSGTTLAASDIPSLDASKITSGIIDAARLPASAGSILEYDTLSEFPIVGDSGKVYIALDTNKMYRWSGSTYVSIAGGVDSVAGKTGVVSLDKGDVGLTNVDNTSDANKPISTATQNALSTKVDTTTNQTIAGVKTFSSTISGSISGNAATVTNGVYTTGDQTIAGVKTFSSTVTGSINGNSATATKLATARTVGGVSFDGSANINLPGVNITGNQNTTGNAGTATKLQTARTINGVSFDGSANISVNTNNSEIIKFDSGTTEGTDLYTFNGSSTKTIDIKAGTNVTLTKTAGSITISANDTSVAWSEVTSKPTFATVATSGSYVDLSNKPTIPTTLPASDVYAWAKASTKPSYAYSEITGTPTIPAAQVQSDWNATTGMGVILNKPTIPTTVSSFTNDSGYQNATQVNSAIQAVVGAAPAALDTLAEIAAQLANDESAVSALTTTVAGKATKATTLSGYGITDAYTKTEFGTLADFTTALS